MNFKVEIQHDTMDCGVTCLKMVANHYGRNYSIDTLRDLSYSTREGVSLLSISETAEKIGFKTVGGRITIDKLVNEVPLPCIIHWNQEHFVVMYKIKNKSLFDKQCRFYIADPALGHISFKESDFINQWISTTSDSKEKGIVLLLQPTPDFYLKTGERKNTKSFKFLFSYFFQYKRFFGQLLLGLIIGSLLQLVFPFLTQSIVDIGINNKNINFIYLVLLAQMTLIVSRMSVDFIRRWLLLHISVRINISLISDFLIKLMKLPMMFFDTKLSGDLIQRIDDHRRVENFITSRTLETLFTFFSLIIFGIVLWIYSIKIFLIFLLGSLVYTFWIFFFLKKRRLLDYKLFNQHSRSFSNIYQLISGMQEIKLQNCEIRKRWEWEDIQADLFQVNTAALKLEQLRDAGNIFINESKNIIITIVAATAVIHNEMSLGMMLATQYIIGQLSLPLEQIVRLIHDFQDTQISLERISEIHHKEDENFGKSINNFNIENKNIEIRDLTFQYEGPNSKKVLRNLNLIIPKNQVTAIVGASGSGKTTLIKLLLQYYNPISGEIRIGDVNLKDINTVFWRNHCGAVMQDGFIFSESIARNIAVSDNEINKARLLMAVEIANIRDFIEELPLKYNTIIGQEGQNLSQGQKQRILIARAVYKNSDFLFFDEATNALDANNEKAIVVNLQQFYKGKTVIIVAHRLSTVKNADNIVVLHDGEIVESGTHSELSKKKGAYYNLVKNQLELGN